MRRFVRQSSILGAALVVTAACVDDAPTAVPRPKAQPRHASAGIFAVGDLLRAAPAQPCREGPHRDFDFWLGEWDVEAPPGSGSIAGTNRIRSEVQGCVVAEYWAATGGLHGWSLNAYDPRTRQWNQHWVAEGGTNLRMSGALVGNAMIMSGVRQLPNGSTVIDRTTWTPVPGGLTQFWDVSSDGGLTFPTVIFNGNYIAHPGAVASPSPGSTLCLTPAYGSADFMIGDWNVSALDGPEVGSSSITSELSHCVLVERFATPKGYEWKAFLSYGRVVQRWFNTSVDSEGLRLELAGTGQPGSVVVTGLARHPGGSDVPVRVTYAAVSANKFTSTWDTSADGLHWTTERVLVYRRT